VPLPFIVDCARRSRFGGLPWLEQALGGGAAAAHKGEAAAGLGEERGADSVESAFELIFSELGERRSGQLSMALTVERALNGNRIAFIEAGTGTGKSLAYLVPAFLFADAADERIIISTHTKNLQEQLYSRDIPLVRRVLGSRAPAEWLMGRENYICSKRIVSHVAHLAPESPGEACALALSAALCGRGTVDSMLSLPEGISPRMLTAPARCAMNACGLSDRCQLLLARKRAREAAILLVNHALLLTDYSQGGGVLGSYSRVIFDEAHHVEHCAMEHLSIRVGRDDAGRILEDMTPVTDRDDRWKYLLRRLESSAGSGEGKKALQSVSRSTRGLEEAFGALFDSITRSLNGAGELKNRKVRYIDGESLLADARSLIDDLLLNINKFNNSLKPILDIGEEAGADDFLIELQGISEQVAALGDAIRFVTQGQDETSVFWLEWAPDGSLSRLCSSPLEVDRLFADYLEECCDSAIFTSATLTHGGGFGYEYDRLGIGLLDRSPLELAAPSPFPYDENCLILLATDLGDPNEEGFERDIADILEGLASTIGRRMVVLFTSYRLSTAAARELRERGIPGPILVQGEGESRETIAAKLRLSPAAILLGVASFWEGVDFPGDELELLVIPKLPFPVPTEPIIAARSDRLRALGEDPFEKLFLPEAGLRLKQGVGRLIRRRDDRGVIVLLDSRLDTRPYGEAILTCLPTEPERARADAISSRAAAWFRGGCRGRERGKG
jgi:Rad3-related DNA helicase